MNLNINKSMYLDLPSIPFPMKDIYRRIGMPDHAVKKHAGVSRLLDEALTIASPLIHPKGAYIFLKNRHEFSESLQFVNCSFMIQSRQVSKLLNSCDHAVLFMTTIGDALETRANDLSRKGDVTLGYILDAIASETADAVADYMHRQYIQDIVAGEYAVTPRFSAGYGDWPITVQQNILKLCRGDRIGIHVTETSLMIPRKSVSAVFGLKKCKDAPCS